LVLRDVGSQEVCALDFAASVIHDNRLGALPDIPILKEAKAEYAKLH
jgi:hypothetical protein